MRLRLLSLALLAPSFILATPLPIPDPTPTSHSLVPRQSFHPQASYAPGTFTVAANPSPFFSTSNAQYIFQTDGNFVIYTVGSNGQRGAAVWSSGTAGHSCAAGDTGSCQLTFRSDGHLAIYVGGSNIWTTGNAYGSAPQYAGTQMNFWGAQLGGSVLQYVDIVDAAGQIVWATGPITCPPPNLLGC